MNSKIAKLKIIVLIIFTALFTASCANKKGQTYNAFYFDTIVSITVYDNFNAESIIEINDLLTRYDQLFSISNPNGDIYKINTTTEGEISNETASVLENLYSYYESSDGLINPGVQTIYNLYEFDTLEHPLPDQEKISEALNHIDYSQLNIEGTHFEKKDKMLEINTGCIAKGYIADKIAECLINNNINNAIINLGGNILVIGKKSDNTPFQIGIEKPFEAENTITHLTINNNYPRLSVVTSGIYERYFTNNGSIYHHLLNPYTGLSLDNELYSVTVVGPSSETADILSTLLYLQGYEKACNTLKNYPEYYGLFVFRDYSIQYSDGFPLDLIN